MAGLIGALVLVLAEFTPLLHLHAAARADPLILTAATGMLLKPTVKDARAAGQQTSSLAQGPLPDRWAKPTVYQH